MIKPSIITATILLLLTWSTAATSQNWTELTAEQQAPYSAVGKLAKGRIGAQGVCTATLIAPDHILTAAHCVWGARDNAPSQLRQYTFAAGWNNGAAVATSSIAEVTIPDAYRPGQTTKLETLNNDWALARLTDPITEIEPLPIVRLPGPWEPVYYLTYSRVHDEAPLLTQGCDHRVMDEGPMQIACPARSGNSGAAVLVGKPENPQIVAIIVAQARQNAFAVIPNDELLALVAATR